MQAVSKTIKIAVYRWAGEKWFFRIGSECVECDLAVSQVKALLSAHPDWPVELEVKPWLTHLWEALRHGGWHAPVVLVDGRIVRQGTVPSRAELATAVRLALARRGMLPEPPTNAMSLPRAEAEMPGSGA